MAIPQEELYSNKIFLNAALPLVKVLATEVPSLAKKFEHAHAVIQVSCLNPEVPEPTSRISSWSSRAWKS